MRQDPSCVFGGGEVALLSKHPDPQFWCGGFFCVKTLQGLITLWLTGSFNRPSKSGVNTPHIYRWVLLCPNMDKNKFPANSNSHANRTPVRPSCVNLPTCFEIWSVGKNFTWCYLFGLIGTHLYTPDTNEHPVLESLVPLAKCVGSLPNNRTC